MRSGAELNQQAIVPAAAAIATTARRRQDPQKPEQDQRVRSIADVVDRRTEHRIPQRRTEETDDRGADPGHRGLHGDALPHGCPERQGRAEEEERRQEDRNESDRRAGDPVGRRLLDRAEIRREREQRAWYGLRDPVAREKCLL